MKSTFLFFQDIAPFETGKVPEGPRIPKSGQGNPETFVARYRALINKYSPRRVRAMAYEILNGIDLGQASVIDKNTWKDLGLIASTGNDIGTVMDRTKTEMGRAYFLGLITRPTSDLTILKNRQALIKEFLTHPELLQETRLTLENMKEGEAHLLSLWDTNMQIPGCVSSQYFKLNPQINTVLNRSPIALDISSTGELTKKWTGVAIQTTSAVLFPLYTLSQVAHQATGFKNPEFLESYVTRFIGTSGHVFALAASISKIKPLVTLVAGTYISMGLSEKYKWTMAEMALDSVLQKKLVPVASYYRNIQTLYSLLSKEPNIAEKLECFSRLEKFVHSESLQPLFSILESSTFNTEAEYFFRRGNVFAAWELLQDKKIQKEIEEVLPAIAEIDTFISIAQLMQESKDQRVTYCFPEYIENSEFPILEVEEFWNPLVDQDKAVVNSIHFGLGAPSRNGVITAPNGSGKSTVLRSLALVVLAQSIGIYPSKLIKFTLFDYIRCSMNPPDSLAEGKSLFQAQTDLIVEINEAFMKMPKKAFSFIILDELFTGASSDQGAALAFSTAEEFSRRKENINIIVTHYPSVTQLETRPLESSTANFKNYRLSVDESLHPLYKLEEGIAEEKIALQVAERRGLSKSIVNGAATRLAKQQ